MKICVDGYEEKFDDKETKLEMYVTHFKVNVTHNDFVEFEVDENIVEVYIDISKKVIKAMSCNCNNLNCIHKFLVLKYFDENEIDLSSKKGIFFDEKIKEEFKKLTKKELFDELMYLNEKYNNVSFHFYQKYNKCNQHTHIKDTLDDIVKILDSVNDANELSEQCQYGNPEWEYKLRNDDRFIDYDDEGFHINDRHFTDLINHIKNNLLNKLKNDSRIVKKLIFDLNDLFSDERYDDCLCNYVCSSIYKEVVSELSFDISELNKIVDFIKGSIKQYKFHLLVNSFYKFINKDNYLVFKELFDEIDKNRSYGHYTFEEKDLYFKNKQEYLKIYMKELLI